MPAIRATKTAPPAKSTGDTLAVSDDEGSGRVTHARMVPESKAYQRRRLDQGHANWDTFRDRLAALDDPTEAVEVSTDDDPIGSGPPWDIRPDDSMYRGRSARSAVGSVQATRDRSPHNTRGVASRLGVDEDAIAQAPATPPGLPVTPHARPKPRPKAKKPRSASIVVSSDEDMDPPPSSEPPSTSSPTKRARVSREDHEDTPSAAPPKKVRRSVPEPAAYASLSDDDLPHLRDIFKEVIAAKKKAVVSRRVETASTPYIDDEAVEENEDGASVQSLKDEEPRVDQYDLEDPFIDDSALVDVADSDQDAARRLRRSSGSSKFKAQGRTPRTTSTPSKKPPPFDDHGDDMDSDDAYRKKGKGRARLPARSPVEVEDPVSDDEGLSAHELAELREARRLSLTAHGKEKSKGKAKAPARSPTPQHDEVRCNDPVTDDEGLSAHELADLMEARRLSLLASKNRGGANRAGESSRQGPSVSTSSQFAPPPSKTTKAGGGYPNPATSKPAPQTPRRRVNIGDFLNRHASAARRSSPPPSTRPQTTLEELQLDRRCTNLVAQDEVLDRSQMDPVLEHTYSNNPPLRRGRLQPWTTAAGIGLVRFSAWRDQCPDMDGELAFDAVTFRESGSIRNPSRTSPVEIALHPLPMSTNRYNMYVYGPPATPLLAFSTGFVEFSQLVAPSDSGLRQRFIRLILHTQELQSLEGFIREVTDLPIVHAQFARDALQFSTRASGSPSTDANQGNGGQGQNRSLRTSPQKMFQSRPSNSNNRVLADNFSLPNDVVVPVYDARRVESFNFETDIHNLTALPLFTGEIPYGSFAGVGYTMTLYKSSAGKWTVGFNIQWVLLIGTPHL